MPKTCCFLTSIFSGFGLDFGGSWASNLEPSWLLRPGKTLEQAPLDPLKLNIFEKLPLGGLRARFWRRWTRFCRPRASIWEGSGTIFSRFWAISLNAKKAKNAKNACQNKTSITNAPRVGGRRCSPPGGFQWNLLAAGSMGAVDLWDSIGAFLGLHFGSFFAFLASPHLYQPRF